MAPFDRDLLEAHVDEVADRVAPGKQTLTAKLPPRPAAVGARSRDQASPGTGSTATASATGGKADDPYALHLPGRVAVPEPGQRLARAAALDGSSAAGPVGERMGLGDVPVVRGPQTASALGDLGIRGAATGGRAFVAGDDREVLAHELAHVGLGGGTEAEADRAATDALAHGRAPWMDGPARAAMPVSFDGGHVHGTGVWLRSRPEVSPGSRLRQLADNDQLETLGPEVDGWYRVRLRSSGAEGGSEEGYIASQFVVVEPAAAGTGTGTGTPAGTTPVTPAGTTPVTPAGTTPVTPAATTPATPAATAGAAVPPPARAPETPILTSTGPLADEDAVAALNRARRVVARLSPTWVHSLQDALAIDAAARTGALNAPTVQAIATFQRDTMHAALTGDLDDATLAALQTAFPALAGATTLTASATTTRWADDAAISRERRNGTFLGAPVVDAHAILLDRLAAGEAYLLQRFPGETPERIRAMLGIRTEGQDFYRVARGGGSYHSRGWAIDINYTSNPWVGGQAAGAGPHGRFEDMSPEDQQARIAADRAQDQRNDEALAIIWRAVWLTGQGEVYSPREMTARGSSATSPDRRHSETTDQIWAHAAAANTAFHAYLSAHHAPTQIQSWIDGSGAIAPLATRPQPPAPAHSHANAHDDVTSFDRGMLHTDLQSATSAQWQQRIRDDNALYRSTSGVTSNFIMGSSSARASRTITDLHLELVRALRDAGGLAWGASDIEGEQVGDFMHFDTRTVPECSQYMAHHR